MDNMKQALDAAVEAVGGQAALARAIGVSQPSVWHWVNKSGRVAAEFVLKVEASSGISRTSLRPDIYPGAEAAVEAAALCTSCDRSTVDLTTRACTRRDCPHAERVAA
jgi:DNA-binding transcriptional regulator YdaS (Cro superfamily)